MHIPPAQLQQVAPVEPDLSVLDPTRGAGDQAHNRKGVDAFATPTFADDTQHLSLPKSIGYPVNGVHHSIFGIEASGEVFYVE
jgi:hypothetical protein